MKARIIIATVITFVLTSCSSAERDFEAVKEGMSKEEVTSLLGERDGDFIIGDGPKGAIEVWHYIENDEIVAAVQFENEAVSSVESNFQVSQDELSRKIQTQSAED